MRYRNFDTLRLVLAASVVFSHSFLLADGSESREPFVQALGPGNIAGLYGVFGFLVISGFLVTRSFRTRASWWSYLASRCLRILPALWVVTVLCAVVLGPIVTTRSLGEYVGDAGLREFILWTSTLLNSGSVGLPGVDFSGSDTGRVVIGTLWTLLPEFICYLLVFAAGLTGLLRLPFAMVAVAVGIWTHSAHPGALYGVGYLGVFFAAGAVLHFVHERRRPGHVTLAACVVGLGVCVAMGAAHEGFAVFGAVLLVQLGTSDRISLGDGARFGDLSYGIYLYGWPVQQLLVWAFDGQLAWWSLFAASLTISVALAWCSWHAVERHAIALGQRLRRRAAAERPAAVMVGLPARREPWRLARRRLHAANLVEAVGAVGIEVLDPGVRGWPVDEPRVADADDHIERDATGCPPALHDERAFQARGRAGAQRDARATQGAGADRRRFRDDDAQPVVSHLSAHGLQRGATPAPALSDSEQPQRDAAEFHAAR